ncbi:glycoside hydrolase family protein [Pseudomonas sp.]|uniref:glycoside hydrolase family protein n=1 Tax=Pseudomonas sp. TaxID=306 RepID=UPI0028974447|nr:glycoside hydrolase family protein [Pseudomonas sp.]
MGSFIRRLAVTLGILVTLVGSPLIQADPSSKSPKRGIAYDLTSGKDMSALSSGISWWYNWSPRPSDAVSAYNYADVYKMDFIPMVWNENFNEGELQMYLTAHPTIRYLLVINEPNLVDQANLTPQAAAALWPRLEAISRNTGVKLVGPAMNWGTLSGYSDPVAWLDAFFAAYSSAHAGRDPQIDYLAFHWYDYGLSGMLDRLARYGRPFWVTEFANWHSLPDGAQIDSVEKQKQQMTEMVALLESRSDVFRYAWFSGRVDNDVHHSSLLANDGTLTELGRHYISLPFNQGAQ